MSADADTLRGGHSSVSYADIARQWRLLSLQTRRLALFLQGSGQEEAMRRAARFEETAKLFERKARESTSHDGDTPGPATFD
jgi:hypothetical protein